MDERQVEALVARLPRDRTIVIYCACPNEVSAAVLAKRLRQHDFEDVLPLRGGLEAWRAAGHPLVALGPAAAVAPPPKGNTIAA